MRSLIFSLALLCGLSAPAFADSFTMSLDGKHFTCTEGGSGGSTGCACREFADSYGYIHVGLFQNGESDDKKYLWQSNGMYSHDREGIIAALRQCAQQKKGNFADLCQ